MTVLKMLVALLLVGLVWAGAQPVEAGRVPVQVTLTAYTCEAHPDNPMHPCGPLRWGGDVSRSGLACPVAWRGKQFEVTGYGVLMCDDTPRHEVIHGLPHVDLRVATYAEAVQIGLGPAVIYEVTGEPPTDSGGAGTTVSRPRRFSNYTDSCFRRWGSRGCPAGREE